MHGGVERSALSAPDVAAVERGLENLGRAESLAYLESRGLPAGQREQIFEGTFGHPLALALVGEMAVQGSTVAPSFDASRDVVSGLLAQLLRRVPSPRHQVALWGMAVVLIIYRPYAS